MYGLTVLEQLFAPCLEMCHKASFLQCESVLWTSFQVHVCRSQGQLRFDRLQWTSNEVAQGRIKTSGGTRSPDGPEGDTVPEAYDMGMLRAIPLTISSVWTPRDTLKAKRNECASVSVFDLQTCTPQAGVANSKGGGPNNLPVARTLGVEPCNPTVAISV